MEDVTNYLMNLGKIPPEHRYHLSLSRQELFHLWMGLENITSHPDFPFDALDMEAFFRESAELIKKMLDTPMPT